MSALREDLTRSLDRLFEQHLTSRLRADAESGTLDPALWQALEEAGAPRALVSEAHDGAGLDPREGAAIAFAEGAHAAPVPLGETMLAAFALSAAGIAPPAGPLALVTAAPGETALRAACGRHAARGVACDGERIVLIALTPLREGANMAGEPRDDLARGAVIAEAASPKTLEGCDANALGALARAGALAGACAAAVNLSLRYAGERVQFGKPIAAFQAIQHQLAFAAGEAAAARVAADAGFRALGRGDALPDIAAAKIRTGRAAAEIAAIAHQVHGAIGFTQDHALHRVTRRLWSWQAEFGSEVIWAARLGERASAADHWAFITARG